jgi:type I restriction enzyme S subunit
MKTEYLEEFLDDATVGFVGSMSKLFKSEGIPLLRGKNIKPYAIDYSDLKFIDSDTHLKWKKSSLAPGDVVLVRVGIPGTCCVIPENIGDINAASLVILKPNTDKLDPYYLSAYLNSLHGRKQIKSLNVGSVQSVLNVNIAKKIKIPNHSLEEQKKISRILNILNSKIELNQKMNETLEEIAKTLFKSWFIDFDPVRAKAEGRPSGLSKEISDLFPDSFEESELGEIPKGWGLIKVEDIAKVTSGKAPPQREISKSDSSPFTIFGGAGPIGFCSKPLEFNKPAIITGRVGTLGKVFFINEECWISDNSILICDAGLYTSIIFSILNLMDMSALNVGSTQPLVTGKDIKNINLNKPPKIVLEKFTSFFDLIKSKQSTLEREVYCLIKLRDTLLPKLISGELKITDAESLVEEVGI